MESKTKTTIRTATQLDNINVKEGTQFKYYRAGSLEFKQLVEEPTYHSQICQHACDTGLNYVMMVYEIPGDIIKRIFIISFTNYQLNTLSTFQRCLQERYMKMFYSNLRDEEFHTDSVGAEYITAYGYTQEHHNLDLYMRLWKKLDDDVL